MRIISIFFSANTTVKSKIEASKKKSNGEAYNKTKDVIKAAFKTKIGIKYALNNLFLSFKYLYHKFLTKKIMFAIIGRYKFKNTYDKV